MLQILQAKNFTPYSQIINKLAEENDLISVCEAVDGENILGYGIYYFEKDCVVIRELESGNDLDLYDGIARAIMFIAFQNGVNQASFVLKNYSFLNKLSIIDKNNRENCTYIVNDIDKILSNCSNCRR